MNYYANGVLNAQSLTKPYDYFSGLSFLIPKSYLEALKANYDSSVSINQFKSSREYNKKLAPLVKELKTQENLLTKNKKLLADTDYIVSKFTEGLISTTEWLKAKADRAGWRKIVNTAEEAYTTAKQRYDSLKDQYKPTTTKRERYNAAVARCNACLDDLKKFYAEEYTSDPPTQE